MRSSARVRARQAKGWRQPGGGVLLQPTDDERLQRAHQVHPLVEQPAGRPGGPGNELGEQHRGRKLILGEQACGPQERRVQGAHGPDAAPAVDEGLRGHQVGVVAGQAEAGQGGPHQRGGGQVPRLGAGAGGKPTHHPGPAAQVGQHLGPVHVVEGIGPCQGDDGDRRVLRASDAGAPECARGLLALVQQRQRSVDGGVDSGPVGWGDHAALGGGRNGRGTCRSAAAHRLRMRSCCTAASAGWISASSRRAQAS